jgi:hypothetical protein
MEKKNHMQWSSAISGGGNKNGKSESVVFWYLIFNVWQFGIF